METWHTEPTRVESASRCGNLILMTRLQQKLGIEWHNPEKRLRQGEYIVIWRNILSADEVQEGFHGVQLH